MPEPGVAHLKLPKKVVGTVAPTRALLALQAMTRVLEREVTAFINSRTSLAHVRRAELYDSLWPLCADTQLCWNALPPDARATLDEARAAMVMATRDLDPPSMASTPSPTRAHRLLAVKPRARASKRRGESKWA